MVSTGFENAILNGLITGSFIALGAIGLSLVYNIADVPNFAHGELLMIGAYMALLVNVPETVPALRRLTVEGNRFTLGVMSVLFVLTAISVLATVYALGGRDALEGSWWPIDGPPPLAGILLHGLAAVLIGAFVALTAPSILAGLVMSGFLLAAVSPFFDKYIFSRFREGGASLATVLMATMGLAFVLRFTMQAYFGGTIRRYSISRTVDAFGYTIDITRAKFIDYYLTGDGLVLQLIDTAPDPNETLFLGEYPWSIFLGIVLVATGAGLIAYWWRKRGIGEYESAQTIGPKLVGPSIGLGVFVVLLAVTATPSQTPEEMLYGTRVRTSVIRLSVIVIAIVLMAVLHFLLQETKLGKAMRASSDNLDLARVTGIDTDRVMMTTWIIAGGYAAIGGVMIGILFHQIVPSMGFFRLLPIFAAVILGGLASVYGAIIGAFAVGLAMEVGFHSVNLVGTVSGTHRVSLAFVLLLIVLLVKPEGIIGRR